MTITQLSYLLFFGVLMASMILDLGLFARKNIKMTVRKASMQYLLWLSIALAYFFFLYFRYDKNLSLLYLSSYFTELSLSIDNLFVFILIFTALKIDEKHIEKALTIGIFLAIVFRILFIFIGISIVNSFHWVLVLFGLFLIYTGFKMFFHKEEGEDEITESKLYKFFTTYLRFHEGESQGKYVLTIDGKKYITRLLLAVILIGFMDIIFALDSIPAVLAITTEKLIVYSSNIFALLGLRALYFILQKLKNKFDYVQQGVSIVLIYIGAKIILVHFYPEIEKYLNAQLSFLFIIVVLLGSVVYSYFYDKTPSENV